MFEKKYTSLAGDVTVSDPAADMKNSKKMGRYKLGNFAVYQPDRRYLPYAAIETIKQDKGTTHVTGCCIGCLPVDRLVIRIAGGKPFVFEFASEEMAEKAFQWIEVCRTVKQQKTPEATQ